MKFAKFLRWKKMPSPQKVIRENTVVLSSMSLTEGFKLYKDIVEWRAHNYAVRSLGDRKRVEYNEGFVDGMRLILKDFKKIQGDYKIKRDKQLKEKKYGR